MGRLVSIKRNVNWPWPGEAVARRPIYLSIYLSKKSRLWRRRCRSTTRAPKDVS